MSTDAIRFTCHDGLGQSMASEDVVGLGNAFGHAVTFESSSEGMADPVIVLVRSDVHQLDALRHVNQVADLLNDMPTGDYRELAGSEPRPACAARRALDNNSDDEIGETPAKSEAGATVRNSFSGFEVDLGDEPPIKVPMAVTTDAPLLAHWFGKVALQTRGATVIAELAELVLARAGMAGQGLSLRKPQD